MAVSIAKATQALVKQQELLIAIESGYVDRSDVQDELEAFDAILAQF